MTTVSFACFLVCEISILSIPSSLISLICVFTVVDSFFLLAQVRTCTEVISYECPSITLCMWFSHRSMGIVAVWSTIVAVAKLSWFLLTLVGSVRFAIFPRTATLSHSFLLLRTSRTDDGSSSAVLISEYWNAYSDGCGTETNVMSLTTIFSRFSVNVKSVSLISVRFVWL